MCEKHALRHISSRKHSTESTGNLPRTAGHMDQAHDYSAALAHLGRHKTLIPGQHPEKAKSVSRMKCVLEKATNGVHKKSQTDSGTGRSTPWREAGKQKTQYTTQ